MILLSIDLKGTTYHYKSIKGEGKMTKQEYMKNINDLMLQCNQENIFIFLQSFMEKQVDNTPAEISEAEAKAIDEYFATAKEEQIEADEAREIIEQLDVNQIRYINAFMKKSFDIEEVEPYGGDLSASYRNGIREQIAYCEDNDLLDLIWKILYKSQPQDEDVVEHHKWS